MSSQSSSFVLQDSGPVSFGKQEETKDLDEGIRNAGGPKEPAPGCRRDKETGIDGTYGWAKEWGKCVDSYCFAALFGLPTVANDMSMVKMTKLSLDIPNYTTSNDHRRASTHSTQKPKYNHFRRTSREATAQIKSKEQKHADLQRPEPPIYFTQWRYEQWSKCEAKNINGEADLNLYPGCYAQIPRHIF